MLLEDLAAAGGELRLNIEPGAVRREGDGFVVETSAGPDWVQVAGDCDGRKSIPKMGSSGYAYDVAEQFGLKIVEPRPALVPFTFASPAIEPIAELAGCRSRRGRPAGKQGSMKGTPFTHRGLSGPSILQISSDRREGEEVVIDLARGRNVFEEVEAAPERPAPLAARQCAGCDRAEAAGGSDCRPDVSDRATGGSVGRETADGGGGRERLAGEAVWN